MKSDLQQSEQTECEQKGSWYLLLHFNLQNFVLSLDMIYIFCKLLKIVVPSKVIFGEVN